MICPQCQSSLQEKSPQCPRCGFSLEKLDDQFNTPPELGDSLSDNAPLFTPHDAAKLRRVLNRLHERFPQVETTIHTRTLPPGTDLTLYTIWAFNRARAAAPRPTGGDNRDILFIIDPGNGRAGMIVGYGLEPLISTPQMQQILATAESYYKKSDFIRGTTEAINMLDQILADIADSLKKEYGIASVTL